MLVYECLQFRRIFTRTTKTDQQIANQSFSNMAPTQATPTTADRLFSREREREIRPNESARATQAWKLLLKTGNFCLYRQNIYIQTYYVCIRNFAEFPWNLPTDKSLMLWFDIELEMRWRSLRQWVGVSSIYKHTSSYSSLYVCVNREQSFSHHHHRHHVATAWHPFDSSLLISYWCA